MDYMAIDPLKAIVDAPGRIGVPLLPQPEGVSPINLTGGDAASSAFIGSAEHTSETSGPDTVKPLMLFSETLIASVATENDKVARSQEIKLWPIGTDPFNGDLYQRLGVPRNAEKSAIKKAFHKLAQMLHPDTKATQIPEIQDLAESAFKSISEAYEVLSDDEKRREYDQTGQARSATQSEVDITADGLMMFEMALNFLKFKMPGNFLEKFYQQHYRVAGCNIIFNYLVNSSFIRKRAARIYTGESPELKADDGLRSLLLHFISYRAVFPEFKQVILNTLKNTGNQSADAINGVVMSFEYDEDYLAKLKELLNWHAGSTAFERTKERLLNRPIAEPRTVQALIDLIEGDAIPRHAKTAVLLALGTTLPEHPELAPRFIRWFDAAVINPTSVEPAVRALAGTMISNADVEQWFWSISRGERHDEMKNFANLMLATHLGDGAKSDEIINSLKQYAVAKGSEAREFAIRRLDSWGEFDPKSCIEIAKNTYREFSARQEAIAVLCWVLQNPQVRNALTGILDGYYEKKEIHAQIKNAFERTWHDPKTSEELRAGLRESLAWLSRKDYTDVGKWAAVLQTTS